MYWQLHLLCRLPERAIVSWLFGASQLSGTLYSSSVNPQKTWRHFPSRREIMRRSPRARRLAIRLPPYDTPRVVPRNNPEFHVDHMHTAGGVCEQTKRLYENIYIDWLRMSLSASCLQGGLTSLHVIDQFLVPFKYTYPFLSCISSVPPCCSLHEHSYLPSCCYFLFCLLSEW